MSLSGSLNLLDTSTLIELPPAVNMTGSIVPTAVGALLGAELTVTPMVCVAVRLPSLAVTVTVVPPTAPGVIVTTALDTLTVALEVSDDTAV